LTRALDLLRGFLGDLRGRALLVVIGCLICQLGLGFTYVSRPLAALIMDDLGLSRTQFSAANTPQLALQALASPVVGYLTVRLGASRVLAASAALFTAVFVFFSRIESAVGLYVAIAGVGLAAAGMGDISVGHAVSQWVRERRGLALGIVYTGSNLGGVLMVQLSSDVAEAWTWRQGLLSVAAVSLLFLMPAALLLVRSPDDRHPSPNGDTETAGPAAVVDDEESWDLKQAMRTRSFWILSATLFTFFFYFVGILDHLVLYLTDAGMSRPDATRYFQQAVGLGVVSKIMLGIIADRIPYRSALLVDYGLVAFSSFVLLLLPSPGLLPIFVVSYGFATAARDVVYPLILGHCFGVRYLGEIYGAMMLILLPGGALGPVFAAALHDHLGSYELAFQGFAILNGLSLLALFFVRDERAASQPTLSTA
jgi:MFS family permease